MEKELDKTYNPKEVEDKIYKMWEGGGYFKPEVNPEGEPFCIIMPPPNANGALHIGHAVFVTLEDIMTRFARMQGKAALWLPGADHAGFETQVVFEKKLEKEGKTRFQYKRDELYKMMWDFTQENKKNMEGQLKKLGASCDWDREKFTLDEDIKKIVYRTFKKLYDDGLVYRALQSVNWCTRHQTTLSDIEIKYVEKKDPLYFAKYYFANPKSKIQNPNKIPNQNDKNYLIIATVRPETMFGDTAIAVNPHDKRYEKFIGQEVIIPLTDRKIPIISDEYVDEKFGTGVVKITPAHDPNDFEIAKQHNLEVREVIDQWGKMNEKAGPYKGMEIEKAREKVVEDMKKKGLIEKIDENYVHTVATCYKCGKIMEPRVSEQWFVAMNKAGRSGDTLAGRALEAVKDGKVKFIPGRFEKIFNHWLKNIRDWNISRQIVWGIQLPVWYRKQEKSKSQNSNLKIKENIYIGEEPPKDKENWVRDTDVFDTWFSSGQWPFATLMTQSGSKSKVKSQKSKLLEDFEKFYPTSVMETGWDILFFWVARMIMMGLYETGEVPFKEVYLHGLVRDKDRQKMSKSKGNVIDPLGVAEEYGTDAVRMALVFGTGAGNDIMISEEKIRGMRNFANKLWNVARFVLKAQNENSKLKTKNEKPKLKTKNDEQILGALEETKKKMTKYYENYQFSLAGEEIYNFIWRKFADQYIEESKKQLKDEKLADNTQVILQKVLSTSLILLHPIMPYVTEEIWSKLNQDEKPLIIAEWPEIK